MSKSRKLILAAMLLAGGYVAAMVLGSVPELVLPTHESVSVGASDASWLAGFRQWMAKEQVEPNVGVLVPESKFKSPMRDGGSYVQTTPTGPTWLKATSSDSVDSNGLTELANQPAAALPPKLLEATPITIAHEPVQSQASSPAPKARITEVRTVAAASQPSASPWDRWPRMPTNEPGIMHDAVPATFQEIETAARPVTASFDESAVVRNNSPRRDPGSRPADALRTHVVIDGDTLTRLADRYLDDSERSVEIYRLNRDVLTNPELLPIGVELRIPTREKPGDSLASLAPVEGLAAADSQRASGMVPVPWMPAPFDDSPQAELLRPLPAGQGD